MRDFTTQRERKKKAASQIQCQVKVNNNKTAATDSDHLNSLTNGFFFFFFTKVILKAEKRWRCHCFLRGHFFNTEMMPMKQ